jgi:Na+/proline symporter
MFARVFTVFGVMTNILVTAMLLTGGAAVISSLTGMVSFPREISSEV